MQIYIAKWLGLACQVHNRGLAIDYANLAIVAWLLVNERAQCLKCRHFRESFFDAHVIVHKPARHPAGNLVNVHCS